VTDNSLPLAGMRILAIEQYGAGPFGSLHLADLGADVIKIEDPSSDGDVGRSVPPYAGDHDSLFFQSLNRNKRSITLDLANPSGRAVFEDLVVHADAVFSNLRGDVPSKLRITYADLAPVNPRIVCCSLSGFGMTGPRRHEPGFDYILQGLCGWMSLTGEPDGLPTKTGVSLVDFSGGMVAALALVAAVYSARGTGIGRDCDVSLYDTAMSMLNYLATWQLTAGHTAQRTSQSAHPSVAPFQNFRTADSWIVIACPKQKFWERLVQVLGDPTWASSPHFATLAGRAEHSAELVPLISEELGRATTEEWVDRLTAAGVPCAPVRTVGEALADPHTVARDLVVTTPHPTWGEVGQVRTAARAGTPRVSHEPAPRLGQHTDDVVEEICGYDAPTRRHLREKGAFGA
jgi:crotonobetainyl-CoA:carnitine CoA-transferase CaiB-like acyl-CoA transferase